METFHVLDCNWKFSHNIHNFNQGIVADYVGFQTEIDESFGIRIELRFWISYSLQIFDNLELFWILTVRDDAR